MSAAPAIWAPRPADNAWICCPCYRFRKYFDVDTYEVLHRCVIPFYRFWKPDFFHIAEENPDLYGPFWLASTLIFLTAVTGNLDSYIHYKLNPGSSSSSSGSSSGGSTKTTTKWTYNVDKVSVAFVVFYLYVSLIPFLFWGMMRYFKSKLKLIHIV